MKRKSYTLAASSVTLALGLIGSVAVGATAIAAMAQTDSMPAASVLRVTATLNPNAPRMGDNNLDLYVVDASGKPVIGLALSTRVEMTSMDMGTTKPAVKDMGNGHYRTNVNFAMSGPWRVTVRLGSSKATLNFEAGTKSAWQSQPVTLSMPESGPTGNTNGMATTMPPMSMPLSMEPVPQKESSATMAMPSQSPGAGYGPETSHSDSSMPGMNMTSDKMTGMSMGGGSMMGDMKPLKMPQLQEQGTYTVTGHENWRVRTGFGKNSGMVGMMSQMMVGGSGMEGMKMQPMKMGFDQQNYTEDQDDDAATSTPTGTPMSNMAGMQPKGGGQADTSMPAMALGDNSTTTENPKAVPSPTTTAPQASAPSTVAPVNAMTGMDMSSSSAAAASSKVLPLKIVGTIAKPSNGDNMLTVSVKDANGNPVIGAKMTTTVVMTSMDMGTTHPPLKDMGNGKYRGTVNFGMSGPWRVTLKVMPPGGGTAQKASFDFNAK